MMLIDYFFCDDNFAEMILIDFYQEQQLNLRAIKGVKWMLLKSTHKFGT
jgi:hypothetical protein